VFGLLPEYRFPLECTMGFLILANGVPVGYGGSSVLFRQVNTGINIFAEYRGSEASYLWVQVMRVYHALFGCTRFIVNPYQFGGDNSEGLQSGAFWFYYRLGFRPVAAEIRQLARKQALRRRRNKDYRSDLRTLRQLASCDMQLTLPGSRASDLFAERWIETTSMLVTEVLGSSKHVTRDAAVQDIATGVARDLRLQALASWSAAERLAFAKLAPLVAAIDLRNWSRAERRALGELLRAKGGLYEADYARRLARHGKFLHALQGICRPRD
jgi:hypothetical protein